MTQIPEDVMKAAREAGISLRFALADINRDAASALWATTGAIDAVTEAFSRAIMAERTRCAEIVSDRAAQHEAGGDTGWHQNVAREERWLVRAILAP